MSQGQQTGRHSSRSSGGRPQQVPTHDRPDSHVKSDPTRSNVYNTPSFLLYGATFVVIVFALTFLIVGAIHIGDCNIEPMIPVWLLVLGIIMIALASWGTVVIVRIQKSPFRKISGLEKIVTGILLLIFLAWFIAGNVWVYSAYAEDPDYGHVWFENGCDKAAFTLAFAAAIALDIMVGIALIGLCVWGVSQFVVRE